MICKEFCVIITLYLINPYTVKVFRFTDFQERIHIMRTDIYSFEKNEASVSQISVEAHKIAAYNGLGHKEEMKLTLLSEELVEMLPNLLHFGAGKFWIENNGSEYEIHVKVEPENMLPTMEREKILAVSKSGENAAAKGIMNKIRIAAEIMLANYAETADASALMYSESPYAFYDMGMYQEPFGYASAWSLSQYRSEAKTDSEAWDELEKSIIANLADDVVVGIIKGTVEITVKKKFD